MLRRSTLQLATHQKTARRPSTLVRLLIPVLVAAMALVAVSLAARRDLLAVVALVLPTLVVAYLLDKRHTVLVGVVAGGAVLGLVITALLPTTVLTTDRSSPTGPLAMAVVSLLLIFWLIAATWGGLLADMRRRERLLYSRWAALHHHEQQLHMREESLYQQEQQASASSTDSLEGGEDAWRRLVQREKSEALGTLVAGLAHELNNPLMAVIGYAELIRTDQRFPPDLVDDLNQVLRAAWSAQQIIAHLGHYDRWGTPYVTALQPQALFERIVEQNTERFHQHGITLVLHIDPTVGPLLGDETQIEVLLQRLCDNAVQALVAWDGKRTIELRARPDGDYVRLEVADSGPGIPTPLRFAIFDPFMTTQPVGKGAGLGLWVAYRIVAAHKGYIQALETPGGGATIAVDVPKA